MVKIQKFFFLGLCFLTFGCEDMGVGLREPSGAEKLLQAPNLVYPENGQTLSPDRIEYVWHAVEGAASYRLKVFDKNKSEIVFENEELRPDEICSDNLCRFSPSLILSKGREHFFEISVTDNQKASGRSVATFNIIETSRPAVPVSFYPNHGQTLPQGQKVEYTWNKVSNAFSYEVLIFDRVVGKTVYRENFLSASEICEKDVCRIQPDIDLSVGKDHFFRVSATTYNGKSDSSFTAFNVSEAKSITGVKGDDSPQKTKSASSRREYALGGKNN